ncbi:MAG: hypothetical protein BIFFINMI_01594 [Phycisphaerae bacterium]|nr:hypothetical protein [Phycisphaerae bacterium]
MTRRLIPTMAVVALLSVSPPAWAATLAGNENVGDGVLSATPGSITANGSTYSWADSNGNGTADDPAAAGLELANYNLTRTGDNVGFTLNLNDGTSNGSITWSGQGTLSGGKITTARAADAGTGAITILGAANITVEGIYANQTSGNWGAGAAVHVTQTGSFYATGSVSSNSNWGSGTSGVVTLTGGGGAGTLYIGGGITSKGGNPGAVNIIGYYSVAIAGSVDAHKLGKPAGSNAAAINITSIGDGGVQIGGVLANYEDYGQGTMADITVTTTGAIGLGGIDSRAGTPTSGDWLYHSGGNIYLTAGGLVQVSGLIRTSTANATAHSYVRNGGNVQIVSSVGAVALADIDTSSVSSNASYGYGGDVTVTAHGNLSIVGAINLSSAQAGKSGDLILTTSAASNGIIYIGDDVTDQLNLAGLGVVSFDSDAGMTFLAGELLNFATAGTGSGTLADPIVTTQTALRAPEGQFVYYNYAPGELNDYLGGNVYRLADENGVAGAGGLLLIQQVPEPTALALLIVGCMGLGGASVRRRRPA